MYPQRVADSNSTYCAIPQKINVAGQTDKRLQAAEFSWQKVVSEILKQKDRTKLEVAFLAVQTSKPAL